MDDIRTLHRAINIFEDCRRGISTRTSKSIIRLLSSDQFLHSVFIPDMRDTTKQEMTGLITQLYDAASKFSAIDAIVEAISEYGYRSLSRTSTAFLTSIVNLGITSINGKAEDIGRRHDHNEIDERDYNRILSKLNRYQGILEELLDYVKDIIGRDARYLSRHTGLPRTICESALYTVPEPDFMDQYKVGFYLNSLLANVYGYVDINPDTVEDFDNVDWITFFKVVFGKKRLPDVASLILLEGVNRIDRYKSEYAVRACWDSITQFALKALNHAPESIRDQMLELYLKRVNKMLADHNIDLRIDLRMIDSFRFEALAKTVMKYKDKITSVMERASALANAKPETTPV